MTGAAGTGGLLARWLDRGVKSSVAPTRSPNAPLQQGTAAAGDHRFEQLFECSGEALVLCNRKGLILAVNPEAARLCGQTAASLLGRSMLELIRKGQGSEPDGQEAASPGESLLKSGADQWIRVRLKATPLVHDGAPQRLFHLRPVSEAKPSPSREQPLAQVDSLTGLPNRALFRDRLTQAMARASRSGEPLALMFLDLDRFKVVNDSLGHEVGDRLLVHVAQLLQHCLRSVDSVLRCSSAERESTLSRLGGDEFTVIVEAVGSAERAGVVAQRLLEALAKPFIVGEEEIVIGASIGISMYPTDDVDLDSLIRHTDMAMYRSKSLGRGMFTFYSDDLNEAVASRLSLESRLRHAIERKEFLLHYQPKVDLRTGEVTGVEALLRWHCPQKGMVRPDRFIAVLEDTGLILPVGAWVIRAACAELASWDRLGLPPVRIAVNMSARQLRHQHLVTLIEDSLRENEVEPSRLEIELTESLVMEDNEASRNLFANFARIGLRIAIDDFGTGHSSLAYLKRFNVDTLKIDRSFVSDLPDNADDAAIASAVIAMGHSLRMKVVAEGVETQAQADFLRELGCDEMQGYLLGRPMPGHELIEWLRRHQVKRLEAIRAVGHDSGSLQLMSLQHAPAP